MLLSDTIWKAWFCDSWMTQSQRVWGGICWGDGVYFVRIFMTIQNTLEQRLDKTTILKNTWGISTGIRSISFEWNKYYDFNSLSNDWDNIWNSFNEKYSRKRQLYRELYSLYKLFFYGCQNLSVPPFSEDKTKWRKQATKSFFILSSLYLYWKKINEIIKEINPTFYENNKLFKFSETRNLFFEHNFNPSWDPLSFFEIFDESVSNTDWYLIIDYHKDSEEQISRFYLDYLNDFLIQQKHIVNFLRLTTINN